MFYKNLNVIGLMTGTSMDGIDCSFITTNGDNLVKIHKEKKYLYNDDIKKQLRSILNKIYKMKKIKRSFFNKEDKIVTKIFINTIKNFIKDYNIDKKEIDIISISGQTVYHNPQKKITIQLGLCKKIQEEFKIKVAGNFRENDIKNGGQGAPIGAFYHQYILKNYSKESAILNLGGIANISCLNKNKLIAFDLGPANSLIDELMFYFYNKNFDNYGLKAKKGKSDKEIIEFYKKDKYFKLNYPKSLDREYFFRYFDLLKKLKKNDSIKTASIMTVEGIILGINLLKFKDRKLILTGGGRKNKFLVENLKTKLKKFNIKIIMIENLNLKGDFLESQAFAYIGARSFYNLPISLPSTTGVKKPISGGTIYK